MTKMADPLAHSASDKYVARHPTCPLLPKPGPHKDSSGYNASSIFKRRRRKRGGTTLLHEDSSSYEEEKEEKSSHTTRVCNLFELVETWPMRVSLLHQALDLFIAPNSRRDNHSGDYEKGKTSGKGIMRTKEGKKNQPDSQKRRKKRKPSQKRIIVPKD
jgi:hypothetical protein